MVCEAPIISGLGHKGLNVSHNFMYATHVYSKALIPQTKCLTFAWHEKKFNVCIPCNELKD